MIGSFLFPTSYLEKSLISPVTDTIRITTNKILMINFPRLSRPVKNVIMRPIIAKVDIAI